MITAVVLAACTDGASGRDDDASVVTTGATTVAPTPPPTSSAAEGATSQGDAPVGSEPTTTDGMRPVPTVPPSTVLGQSGAAGGVIEIAPTLVPPPPPTIDPGEIAEPTDDVVAAPTTAATVSAAPAAAAPAEACARLAGVGVADLLTDGSDDGGVSTEELADATCRWERGGTVVEVRVVTAEEVRDDWALRPAAAPVDELGDGAVGFDGVSAGDGTTDVGYTIAAVVGADGVIVTVQASAGSRRLAVGVIESARQAAG